MSVESLEKKIRYKFKDPLLLEAALTHKSFHNQNLKVFDKNNERLEFLGDSVLGLSLSTFLMEKFSQCNEGQLSKMRASLVNEVNLFEVATELGLSESLILGRGEINSGGDRKPRIVSSALEALIGAIYLDSDFKVCHEIIRRIFSRCLENIDSASAGIDDHKTKLQERLQEAIRLTPTYKVVNEKGPDHDKKFQVVVFAGEQILGKGEGRSKKQAEQSAAAEALQEIL